MKQIIFNENIAHFDEIVDSFCLKPHTLSNYYGIDNENLRFYASKNNFVVQSLYNGYSRIYLMSDDTDELVDILLSLPSNSVINIPSRKGIDEWKDILERSGYKPLATYHRYIYSNYRKGNNNNLRFAEISDVPHIVKALDETFSPLTGHLPNETQLETLINDKCIVVGRDENGVINGALCYVIKGKKCELPFWFDKSRNGLSLLYNVFYLCHLRDVRNILFWVNDENKETIGIHKLLGAKEDGMTDFIFYR